MKKFISTLLIMLELTITLPMLIMAARPSTTTLETLTNTTTATQLNWFLDVITIRITNSVRPKSKIIHVSCNRGTVKHDLKFHESFEYKFTVVKGEMMATSRCFFEGIDPEKTYYHLLFSDFFGLGIFGRETFLHYSIGANSVCRIHSKTLTECKPWEGHDCPPSYPGRVWKKSMEMVLIIGLIMISLSLKEVDAIRFVLDREECLSEEVKYDGDTLHTWFVVVKDDSEWHFNEEGVDLVIKGPSGDQIHDFRNSVKEKYEFVAFKKGIYRFCFTNKSPYHETIDFTVHVEYFSPVYEELSKLEEALYNVQFEQHWLEAQSDRRAIGNVDTSRRAIHKAILELITLVGFSCFQVFLLVRLINKKDATVRV
ncbi:hypothetical protein ACFE04_030397 [Oxalis oulophora]